MACVRLELFILMSFWDALRPGFVKGYPAIEHALGHAGAAGILCGWAMQGYSADLLPLGTARIFCGWTR